MYLIAFDLLAAGGAAAVLVWWASCVADRTGRPAGPKDVRFPASGRGLRED